MTKSVSPSPASLGFRVPGEFEGHLGCIMSWPVREELWGGSLAQAKHDFAAVANAISRFEEVVMVCPPGHEAEVSNACAAERIVSLPINDSWARDNGPVFVCNEAGELAVVGFGFNAWGERWRPYDDDAKLPARIADSFQLPYFPESMILEGGSWFTDGNGTLYTTEQCLLNPNRNPDLNRQDIEHRLRESLGIQNVVWLRYGHSADCGPEGTDGHIDGVFQVPDLYRVILEVPTSRDSTEYERARENLHALREQLDAFSLATEVIPFDPGPRPQVSYLNHYLANGAVIVPVAEDDHDEPALAQLQAIYPDREIVGVPGKTIMFGGGGPHCITQQIPAGIPGLRMMAS